jgi:UDP:flavonoid glycosyltransferase YjiC (YdhE family)
MKVLFVSPPFSGHLNRLVPLAEAALAAGHDCVFLTGRAKAAAIEARGFRVLVPASIPHDAMERIANWPRQAGTRKLELIAQFRANLRVLKPLAVETREILLTERPDAVVADFTAAVVAQWCEALQIPWITTTGTPFAIEARSGIPSYTGGWLPRAGLTGTVRDAAGRLAVRAFKRLVYASHARQIRPLLPSLYRADGTEAIYSGQKILGFGLSELEFDRDWPPAFEMIGPVYGALEDGPPLDLPPARKYVLASIGTHLHWAKARLVNDVEELARAFPAWHFVVTLGRAEEAASAPRQVAPNVTVTAFVPYHRDLARFHAVIHHGGSGVTYACLRAGVPSLVIPHDYDQFDYAARIVHHGLGLSLKRLSDAQAPAALARLMEREAWPNLPLFQAAAARYRPEERFLAALAEVTGAGAKACRQ